MQNITTRAGERKACRQRPEIVNDAGLLFDLDPERHRIILQHWFGWDLIDDAGVVVNNLREHQHARGLG